MFLHQLFIRHLNVIGQMKFSNPNPDTLIELQGEQIRNFLLYSVQIKHVSNSSDAGIGESTMAFLTLKVKLEPR